MPSAFPASYDALSNPIPDDPLASGTVPHATQHANLNDIVEAMQAKIGLGPVPGGPSTGPAVLRRTSLDHSDWGQIQTGDLADGAITGLKIGTGEITTTQILNGTILDADISGSAAIALTKLAHVGAGNVLKSTGSANVGGQVVNADIAAAAAIAYSKLALSGQITNADLAGGIVGTKLAGDTLTAAQIAANAVGSSELADGAIARYSQINNDI